MCEKYGSLFIPSTENYVPEFKDTIMNKTEIVSALTQL